MRTRYLARGPDGAPGPRLLALAGLGGPVATEVQPRIDLSLCEQEPIHTPGAIQPHGAFLAVSLTCETITHVSANVADFLGREPAGLLGVAPGSVLGQATWRALTSAPQPGGRPGAMPPQHCFVELAGRPLHLRAYHSGDHVCVDIEPALSDATPLSQLLTVQPILESFKGATSTVELCELAVRGLRGITGFDRVIAYRFHSDGHGEVVAEDRDPSLGSYLGRRYPASDIPAQARQQYFRQRIGTVADSAYEPVPIITTAPAAALDLTHSTLRSVSPVHREYMRNMKTAASLTLALAPSRALWGLLVCHHGTPRIASLEVRAAAELIGQVVSVLVSGLSDAEVDAQIDQRNATLRILPLGLAVAKPLPEALAGVEMPLLHVIGATGAIARLSGSFLTFGRTPPRPIAERVLNVLHAQADGKLLAMNDLGHQCPEFAEYTSEACGALILPLDPRTDDALLWFRPEQATTVTWGGNPAEHMTVDPVTHRPSPRASFEAWKEIVTGRSIPWTQADQQVALQVGHALQAEIAQRTRLALVSAQAASLAKSRYLAGMSHELRTPLNGILGYAQLLRMESDLNPLQTARVDAMISAGTHLLQIISQVLELSEIEAHHEEFKPTEFDPRGVAIECVNLVRPMADAKRLTLGITVTPDVPVEITTDPTRFRQILINLLGNAVKFTQSGSVELGLRLAADRVSLRVDVIDTGPGIDVSKRHRLFHEFQQLGTLPDAASGSAGLGLAITARLVVLLGGCLGHKENPKGGSIFWLELPLFGTAPADPSRRSAQAVAAVNTAVPPMAHPSALRVLVADDSSINRDVAHAFLRAAGHEVAFAEDGVEAVAAAGSSDFDIILMDLRMPRLGGIEATRRIRALPGERGRVPIVALTAQAFSDQVDECRAAAMDGHLAKPFTMDGLLESLATAIASRT